MLSDKVIRISLAVIFSYTILFYLFIFERSKISLIIILFIVFTLFNYFVLDLFIKKYFNFLEAIKAKKSNKWFKLSFYVLISSIILLFVYTVYNSNSIWNKYYGEQSEFSIVEQGQKSEIEQINLFKKNLLTIGFIWFLFSFITPIFKTYGKEIIHRTKFMIIKDGLFNLSIILCVVIMNLCLFWLIFIVYFLYGLGGGF